MIYNVVLISGVQQSDSDIPESLKLTQNCKYESKCKGFFLLYQFSSVTQSCLTLCDPMNRSTPGLPVHYQLPEFTQTHVH